MEHNGNSLSALAGRADTLHSLIVKHLVAYIVIGLILGITMSRAVQQVERTEIGKLRNDLQEQVNISGMSVMQGNLCAWWDSVNLVPVPGQLSPDPSARQAASQKEMDLISATKMRCDTSHPYNVEFKYFDFPFSFDLQYWAFVIPVLFLLAFGFAYRLWHERRLVHAAGHQLLAELKTSANLPFDGVMRFGGSCYGPSIGAQTTELTEGLLGLSLLGVTAYILVQLSSIWSHIDVLLLSPLIKIYGLAVVLLLCFLADCSRRLRSEVEEWFGQQLPCTKIPSQIAIVAAVGRAWLFARRTVTLYASAVLGGGFAVTSLFLACGVSGCGGKKVNGLELFKVRTPASWYLNELMDPPWKQIGQGIYVLGIFLATAALISLFVSFIRKSWLTQVFSNSVYAYLVLFSALFLFYELAWGDIVLTIWPLYSLALCLCLVLASRRARRRIAGWSSRIDGKNTRMYSAGFVFYTSLLAAYGAATLARDRFWGVLAFATGQFLLFRCVHIARAEKAQESPPPKSIRQPLPTAPHP